MTNLFRSIVSSGISLSLLALAPALAQAQVQATANPLSATNKVIYMMIKSEIIKAAQEMPESDYNFQPTPDVRTFGQLVGHVADAQYEFCDAITGNSAPPSIEKSTTTKAALVAALQTAFSYCDKVYSDLTDAHAADMVKFFGRQMPKLSVLTISTAHDDEHYGNMVTYLRIKGLVPPSSQNSKPATSTK